MHLTQQALVLAALGLGCALAQPAGSLHRHLHKHKRDVDWKDPSNYKDVNWATVSYGGSPSSAATPAVAASSASASASIVASSAQGSTAQGSNPVTTSAAPSSSSAASPSTTSSSAAPSSNSKSNSNSNSILYQPSGCPSTGFGARTAPVANSNVDTYIGNVGSPYGCNMLLVPSASSHDYTNTFTNHGSAPLSIIIWNKAGPGGANAGQSSPPTLGFTLAPGAVQVVAFDENSQVGWSRDCDRRADDNAPDCTWGEGDFGNLSNAGWSGYDVSSIQNSRGNDEAMCITSSERNGGKESSNRVNNWYAPQQADMGAGGKVPPEAKPVQLLTVFG